MEEKTVEISVGEYKALVANAHAGEMLLSLIAERNEKFLPIEVREITMLARLFGVAKEEENESV